MRRWKSFEESENLKYLGQTLGRSLTVWERLRVGLQSRMKEKGSLVYMAESLATRLSTVVWKVENMANQVIWLRRFPIIFPIMAKQKR